MKLLSILKTSIPGKLLLFYGLFILACSSDRSSHSADENGNQNIADENYNNSINAIAKPDKLIVIKCQKNIKSSSPNKASDNFEITDNVLIKQFIEARNHFTNTNFFDKTAHFQILLSDKNQNFSKLLVSIPKNKDSVYIFTTNHQCYFSISQNLWKQLLSEKNQITIRQLEIKDLKKARDIYKYCIQNNISFVFDSKNSDKWLSYEGAFEFKLSRTEKEYTKEEILNTIKKDFNKDSFEIGVVSFGTTCANPECSKYQYHTHIKVFCSKTFYNRFRTYKPKSRYHKFYPSFTILGKDSLLTEIETNFDL